MLAVLAAVLAAVPAAAGAPVAQAVQPPQVEADAWILVDADSGAVLAERNSHDRRLVASTVKIMTALTALRVLGPDGTVTVSEKAAGKEAYRLGMRPGERWPVIDTLYGLILESGNDVAYAIAESSGGSVSGFAAQMAAVGEDLGLKDSTFADPSGFDNWSAEIGPSYMSAYDLAIAGRAALAHPTLATVVATDRYSFVDPAGNTRNLRNHSKQLRPEHERFYDGTNGVKTGWTRRASGTYVSSATRNGRTLIAVQLGNQQIYGPVQALLDFGFANPSYAGTGATLPPVPAWVRTATTIDSTTLTDGLVTVTTIPANTTVAPTTLPAPVQTSAPTDAGGTTTPGVPSVAPVIGDTDDDTASASASAGAGGAGGSSFGQAAVTALAVLVAAAGGWVVYARTVVVPRKRARARARRAEREAAAAAAAIDDEWERLSSASSERG